MLYDDLAELWPLFSPPSEYVEEAAWFAAAIPRHAKHPVRTVLELGSGGGNMASHLKRDFELILSDLSPGMLAESRKLNPECVHLEADMRRLRLGRTFDAVFIHDAICHMTTEADLKAVFDTARAHLSPRGLLVVVPDFVRESFVPGSESGGSDATDGSGRGVRWVEWTWDPDPAGSEIITDYGILVRSADGSVRVVHERHRDGAFPRAVWHRLLREAGFDATSESDPWRADVFFGLARGGG